MIKLSQSNSKTKQVHINNLFIRLEHRLDVAKQNNDAQLISHLESERQYLQSIT